MTNDYETTIAFEKYEEIFWKKLNKEFDLENMGDETKYKLRFFSATPSIEEMEACIDSNGYLHAHDKLISADDGFVDTPFGLVANFPDAGGFELALNYHEVRWGYLETGVKAGHNLKDDIHFKACVHRASYLAKQDNKQQVAYRKKFGTITG